MKYIILISAVLTAVGLPVMSLLARNWNLERRNFKGDAIPAGFGFLIVLVSVPAYLGMLLREREPLTGIFLAGVVGFGLVGLVDDLYGNRRAGGFGGHLRLLMHGKVSTGFIKAAFGGILALVLGMILSGHRPAEGILNGLVIALCANLLNLLDLRPGRAVSCFWACVIVLAVTEYGRLGVWPQLAPVLVPAVLLTALDRSARVMLGDAGSNLLGAVLGLALVYSLGLAGKLTALAVLAGVHMYAEKYSISGLIERNRVLRSLDRLLGER